MSDKPLSTVYKKIAIPLRGFKRKHGPIDKPDESDEFGDNGSFVGRSQLRDSLGNLLTKTSGKRGTYLIAGYRGSGKTTLINYVINKYNKEKIKEQKDNKNTDKSPVIKVLLNLGNDSNLTPIRLFYSIANILLDEFRKKQGKIGGINLKLSKTIFRMGMVFPFVILALWVAVYKGNTIAWESNDYISFNVTLLDLFFIPISIFFLYGWFSVGKFFHENKNSLKVESRLKYLIERITFETTGQSTLGNKYIPFSFMKGRKSLPVHAREAEEMLVSIIGDISKVYSDLPYEVMFVFDEIDKLSRFDDVNGRHGKDDSEKINNINHLLGSIKYFITTCNAKFFIIAGRETLDSYYSEKGSNNSLYESLFDTVYEVPSLLTDDGGGVSQTQISTLIEEYLCKTISWNKCNKEINNNNFNLKLYNKYLHEDHKDHNGNHLPPEKCRDLIYQLRSFVSYLTFHSWGNPKRLSALLENFIVTENHVKSNKCSYETFGYDVPESHNQESCDWLSISINDKRSFALASEIFTLFQHHLSREVSKTSDKLTVSALSSLHFLLKLHPYGFTRESLHRMSEAINIYRSPELNTIVDDLLSQILISYIRRVRNGSYRYRFHSGLEQELRYISHVNELESASYNFSLNSMGPVKKMFEKYILDNNELDEVTKTKLYMTLGDICAIEQSYNSAAINYGIAHSLIEKVVKNGDKYDLDSAMLLCELGIKHGDLEERRQNYNHAASIYKGIEAFVEHQITSNELLREAVLSGDSKWDMFKQAAWAGMFLSLKRSPASSIKDVLYLYSKGDPRIFSRKATLSYFMGDLTGAMECYHKVVGNSNPENMNNEKSAYIIGNSLVGLAEVCLLKVSLLNVDPPGQDGNKKSRSEIMDILGQFVIHSSLSAPSKKNYFYNRSPSKDKDYPYRNEFSYNLSLAAKWFKKSGLYINAVVSYIKLINYWTIILDFYVQSDLADKPIVKDKIRKIFREIDRSGKDAVECIVFARQLDSSQFIKTFIIKDQPENLDSDDLVNLVNLFDVLLDDEGSGENLLVESIFWQQSLWAHKLASALCWTNLVRKKLLGKEKSRIDKYPVEMSSFSVRASITMRWVIARDMLNDLMPEKKIIFCKSEPVPKENMVFNPLKYLKLIRKNPKVVVKLEDWGEKLSNEFSVDEENIALQTFYQISRNLYFSLQSIRLISRKNLDLVYPNMAQIYFLQWKTLSMMMTIHIVRDYINDNGACRISSVRSYALEIQRKLIEIDKHFAPNEQIPPTHFDYEHILMRTKSNLLDAMNINDSSSRVRSSILQQKHYCHDDHSDPEFRLDWTLAHMFSPSAYYLLEDIDDTHEQYTALAKGPLCQQYTYGD